MGNKFFLLFIIFISNIFSCIGQTEISGAISGNITWDKENSPYIVTDDIALLQGSTLTITPGTTVEFYDNVKFYLRGIMVASGQENDSIYFKASSNSWHGIIMENSLGATATLEYFVGSSTNSSFIKINGYSHNKVITINHSRFHHNNNVIYGADNAAAQLSVDMSNSSFHNNEFVHIFAQKLTVTNCIFRDNYKVIHSWFSSPVWIYNSSFYNSEIYAVQIDGGEVINSTFINNGSAVQIDGDLKVHGNFFSENQIALKSIFPELPPNFDITGNYFCDNFYAIKHTGIYNITLDQNCFCLDTDSIHNTIFDGLDDIQYGIVTYEPFFDDELTINDSLEDTLIFCENEILEIDPGVSGLYPKYQWKNIATGDVISEERILMISESIDVELTITSGCNQIIRDFTVIENTPILVSGEREDISITEDNQFTITIDHLSTENNDGIPDNITIEVLDGVNYTIVNENTILPDPNYFGPLELPIIVYDGNCFNEQLSLNIDVINLNDPPEIGIIESFSLCPGNTKEIDLRALTTDIDNLPDDMTFTASHNNNVNGLNLNIDNETGLLYVTNNTEETKAIITIEVIAEDLDGATAIQNFEVNLEYMNVIISSNRNILTASEGNAYQWFRNGIIIEETNGGNSQTIIASEVGKYKVAVSYADDCVGESEELEIDKLTRIEDLIKDYTFKIYPNPANNLLKIDVSPNYKADFAIQLLDIQGKIILNAIKAPSQIDLSSIPKGVYFLHLYYKKEFLGAKKIIKY